MIRANNLKEYIWTAGIIAASAIGLYIGWKAFYFMTDDALIAFRYVSNSMLGYGYVWNAPPFLPVEGYTSFLWVFILDMVWRVAGLNPMETANTISLILAFLNLVVVFLALKKITGRIKSVTFRYAFISLALLGILTNRTFLAWTSSGMETALFNFCLSAWIYYTIFFEGSRKWWLVGMCLTSSLSYLSRPDGVIFVLATLLMVAIDILRGRLKFNGKGLLGLTPILIVPAHFLWRKWFYGEWLPNTYYAKYVAAWPEAGWRYLASFVLEYSVWLWLIIAVIYFIRKRKDIRNSVFKIYSRVASKERRDARVERIAITIVALLVHVYYYTFIIGGDHFEYRVYSWMIPWLFVSIAAMLSYAKSFVKPIIWLAVFILLSWPIQWTHWFLTKDINTRRATHILRMPVADSFPGPLKWYAQSFDDLQDWLIFHHVCMRHQEHKIFYKFQKRRIWTRAEGSSIKGDGYPVIARSLVGVLGWVLPYVNIIDKYGLNDYVIARNEMPPGRERLMAHDRQPPEGYVESFMPNVRIRRDRRMVVEERPEALTAEKIIELEKYWREVARDNTN